MIETIDDIIEELADKFGIYGVGPEEGGHSQDCRCRICFCAWLKGRIEKAVLVERSFKLRITESEARIILSLCLDELGQYCGKLSPGAQKIARLIFSSYPSMRPEYPSLVLRLEPRVTQIR